MNLRRDVFQAIADPTRRAILLLVASQSMTAGTIAANFDTARPTISKHLQILTECELLQQEPNGREIYYHFNPKNERSVGLPGTLPRTMGRAIQQTGDNYEKIQKQKINQDGI